VGLAGPRGGVFSFVTRLRPTQLFSQVHSFFRDFSHRFGTVGTDSRGFFAVPVTDKFLGQKQSLL
jgi:hypothetical protein